MRRWDSVGFLRRSSTSYALMHVILHSLNMARTYTGRSIKNTLHTRQQHIKAASVSHTAAHTRRDMVYASQKCCATTSPHFCLTFTTLYVYLRKQAKLRKPSAFAKCL